MPRCARGRRLELSLVVRRACAHTVPDGARRRPPRPGRRATGCTSTGRASRPTWWQTRGSPRRPRPATSCSTRSAAPASRRRGGGARPAGALGIDVNPFAIFLARATAAPCDPDVCGRRGARAGRRTRRRGALARHAPAGGAAARRLWPARRAGSRESWPCSCAAHAAAARAARSRCGRHAAGRAAPTRGRRRRPRPPVFPAGRRAKLVRAGADRFRRAASRRATCARSGGPAGGDPGRARRGDPRLPAARAHRRPARRPRG